MIKIYEITSHLGSDDAFDIRIEVENYELYRKLYLEKLKESGQNGAGEKKI